MANLVKRTGVPLEPTTAALLLAQQMNKIIRAIHAATTVADIKTAIEKGGTQEVSLIEFMPAGLSLPPMPAKTEEA